MSAIIIALRVNNNALPRGEPRLLPPNVVDNLRVVLDVVKSLLVVASSMMLL